MGYDVFVRVGNVSFGVLLHYLSASRGKRQNNDIDCRVSPALNFCGFAMDGFSILNGAWRTPLTSQPEYHIGNAVGWLSRAEKQSAANYALAGRLYVAKSGWLLLSVPNALVRGVYDAMSAPGAELPLPGTLNVPAVKPDVLNAHISVMTADEVKKIGAENINERGHMFSYALGPLQEITPRNIAGVSKLWALQVSAPWLTALRKSYGLSPQLNGHSFHITVAVRRKGVLQDNGVRKAAAAEKTTTTTYDCSCSGPCMCPETCTCRQHGRCSKTHKSAAEFSRSGTKLSRSGQKDLLSGGEADNLPDRDFSAAALIEGAEHEHEHTDNDQIAKEIAKDHLQEDPAYYKKVAAAEIPAALPPKPKALSAAETAPPEIPPPVTADVNFNVVPPPALPPSGQQLPAPQKRPEEVAQKQAEDVKRIIAELRAAKAHSDNKRYSHKNDILRRLMTAAPKDWNINDPKPHYKGITHTPTNFRFHVEPTMIPAAVKAAYKQPGSAYMSALYNAYGSRSPLTYNYKKTIAGNIQDQMMLVKQRGDFMRTAKKNHQRYQAAIDPKYRYELAMKAMNNELEEEPIIDRVIGQYGDGFINTAFGGSK